MRKYTCTIAFALSCTFSTFAQTPCLTQNKLMDAQKVKVAEGDTEVRDIRQ